MSFSVVDRPLTIDQCQPISLGISIPSTTNLHEGWSKKSKHKILPCILCMIGVARTFAIPLILQQSRMSTGIREGICVPCSGLNQNDLIQIDQLQKRVKELIPLWTINDNRHNSDADSISNVNDAVKKNHYSINRKFTAKNFQSAMDCLNEIGRLAEEQNHHPDLHITNYRDVHIELYTHKLNGVTENDIILAHAIDTKISIKYSPKWLKSHPEVSRAT